MFKRDITFYIVDIFIAIDKVERYTNAFDDAQALLYSEIVWDATIRELEIIGEATKHLLNAEVLPVHYRRIVDFRNQINHAYFGIDENIVWDVVTGKLNSYKSDLEDIVKSSSLNLMDAIEEMKKEHYMNENMLKVLKRIKEL